MRYESSFSFRPSRPHMCRKHRFSSRLNPSGRFAGLDKNRRASGRKITRAMDVNVSDRGSEHEHHHKKKSRESLHLLTGFPVVTIRFSVLTRILFRFCASRFLSQITLAKYTQSDQKIFSFRPENDRFIDRGSSQIRPEARQVLDRTETDFWLPGFSVSTVLVSGFTLPRFRFPLPCFPVLTSRVCGFNRPQFPVYSGRYSVFCRPPKRFVSPPVIRNRMEAVLHTAPSCQRAGRPLDTLERSALRFSHSIKAERHERKNSRRQVCRESNTHAPRDP